MRSGSPSGRRSCLCAISDQVGSARIGGMNFARYSCVRRSGGTTVLPSVFRRPLTAGSSRASLIALLRRRRHVIRSIEFGGAATAKTVRERALFMIEALNGTMNTLGATDRVEFDGVLEVQPDGKLHHTLFPETAFLSADLFHMPTRRTRQPLNELPLITQDRALGSRTREPWKPERCAFRVLRTYAGRRQSVPDGGGGGVGLH
jgi:hypothetical protein